MEQIDFLTQTHLPTGPGDVDGIEEKKEKKRRSDGVNEFTVCMFYKYLFNEQLSFNLIFSR